jgi:hypothetical protein
MLCRHCHTTVVSRPRGLCWSCYYTDGVRDMYPSISKFGRRGLRDFCGRGAAPSEPTDARPGSEAKVLVLIERARRRQALWHPDDVTLAGSPHRVCALAS